MDSIIGHRIRFNLEARRDLGWVEGKQGDWMFNQRIDPDFQTPPRRYAGDHPAASVERGGCARITRQTRHCMVHTLIEVMCWANGGWSSDSPRALMPCPSTSTSREERLSLFDQKYKLISVIALLVYVSVVERLSQYETREGYCAAENRQYIKIEEKEPKPQMHYPTYNSNQYPHGNRINIYINSLSTHSNPHSSQKI